jgi:hypothetical protein
MSGNRVGLDFIEFLYECVKGEIGGLVEKSRAADGQWTIRDGKLEVHYKTVRKLSQQAHSQSMASHRTEVNRIYAQDSAAAKVSAGFSIEFARKALGVSRCRVGLRSRSRFWS